MKSIGITSIWPLSSNSFAGTEKFVLRLARALKNEGFSITCISPSKDSSYREFPSVSIEIKELESIDEVTLKNLMDQKGVLKVVEYFSNSLNRIMKEHNYDYWIINSPFFSLANPTYKSIMVLHDNPSELTNYFGEKNGQELLNILEKYYTKTIVVPSKHYQEVYGELLKKQISVIPHSIDPVFVELTKKITQSDLSASQDIENIIFLPARLEPKQKGQDIAIEAVSRLKSKDKYVLRFSGYDPTYKENKKKLEGLANDLHVNLEINSYTDEAVIRQMINSKLILLPSRYESFGYSAQESLSLGKTVILSDIPTYKEISDGAPNAVLFESANSLDLSKKIEGELQANQKIMPSTSWFERYSPTIWAKKYLELF